MKSIKKPIILFLIIIVGVGFFLFKISGTGIPNFSKKSETKEEKKETPKPELKKEENTLFVKYDALDSLIQECCSSLVKEIKTSEDGGEVRAEGKATFPFTSTFKSKVRLTVENNKLKGNFSEILVGKVESPEVLKSKLDDLLQKSLDTNINNKYVVKDVKINKREVEINIIK